MGKTMSSPIGYINSSAKNADKMLDFLFITRFSGNWEKNSEYFFGKIDPLVAFRKFHETLSQEFESTINQANRCN